MHHNQPVDNKALTLNETGPDLNTNITINNNSERYGADRRFSIAYSEYIEKLLFDYLEQLLSGKKTKR